MYTIICSVCNVRHGTRPSIRKGWNHCSHRLFDSHSTEHNSNWGTEYKETQAYEIISVIDYTIN